MKIFCLSIAFFCVLFSNFTFSQIPTNGLVASFPFNGNANDESGNGYDALVFGPNLVSDRNGLPDNAYYFDGVDDTLAIQKPLNDMLEMSISFWIKSEMDGNNIGNIFCDGSVNSGGNDFLLNVTSNRIGLRADKNGNSFNYENSSPSELTNLTLTNNWHHVVWTFDQSASEIYFDGNLLVSIPEVASNVLSHDPTPIFGAREVWTNKDKFFKGYLDDINIYNKVLSVNEISQLTLLCHVIHSQYLSWG